ncbi:MAG: hypothetical protein N3E41_08670 [Thermofilaceae archaeon]|nr:hypothetical protein [Thermofilaceae archaeon]
MPTYSNASLARLSILSQLHLVVLIDVISSLFKLSILSQLHQ